MVSFVAMLGGLVPGNGSVRKARKKNTEQTE
jgi:hypothetical protein